jgi:hypothetical protein
MRPGPRLVLILALAAAGCSSDDPADGDGGADGDSGADAAIDAPSVPFSFFVTSLDTMRSQSGSQDGFGGDLGGLAGADAICQSAAAAVGFGGKTWRAFLSVTEGPEGGPVNAIDRIGEGPWYDRNARLIAADLDGLRHTRPDGDPQTIEDLPDETGQPLTLFGDTHDVMTGSNESGELERDDPLSTCNDWTASSGSEFEHEVRVGHSWPAMSGQHWITAHPMPGCSPGVNLIQDGPGEGDCVGCGGGWGGIYCFALTP